MPITINPSQTVNQVLSALMDHDPNLSTDIANTQTFRFKDSTPINHLLSAGPINIAGVEWDFEWNNGLRSLARRGFYKIVGNITLRETTDYQTGKSAPTWSADVLYCPNHDHHHQYFKFFANVGPLINLNGIGFNLSNSPAEKIITSRLPPPNHGNRDKGSFFQIMLNRTFYVSQQVTINGGSKQTAWFLF